MDVLLTTAEIALRWGKTQRWVQKLCEDGKLKATLMGKTYVARERDVENYQHQPVGRPGTNGHKARVKRPAAKLRSKRKTAGKKSKP